MCKIDGNKFTINQFIQLIIVALYLALLHLGTPHSDFTSL